MPDTASGEPTAAMIITYTDGLATIFKTNRAAFDTLLTSVQTFRGLISTIGHDGLESATKSHRDAKVQAARYESYFKSSDFSLIQDLQNIITGALPGWSLSTYLPLNGWLRRINGNTGIVTPAAPLVLTAAATGGGALSTAIAGNAPRVVFTYVGATDMDESLPSTESAQVAIAGGNNSYTCAAIAGNVPAGVTKMRVYRGLPGIATGTWYWDQDVAVVAGTAHPSTIVIQRPDAFLATTIQPPSWNSCLMTPEFAYLYALATSTTSPVKGSDTAPYQLTSQGMLSPTNVALGPSNQWVGIGNTAASARFGTRDLTGAYVIGTPQLTNVPANNSQGFRGGANGIQVRATTMLNGTYHPTISYTYLSASNPITPATQTGVVVASDFAGGITDETKTFAVTAGRLVLTVTETASTGSATTGVVAYESVPIRTY